MVDDSAQSELRPTPRFARWILRFMNESHDASSHPLLSHLPKVVDAFLVRSSYVQQSVAIDIGDFKLCSWAAVAIK